MHACAIYLHCLFAKKKNFEYYLLCKPKGMCSKYSMWVSSMINEEKNQMWNTKLKCIISFNNKVSNLVLGSLKNEATTNQRFLVSLQIRLYNQMH